MPRPLVLGNGSLLVAIDPEYCIRDLYFPRVGYPNHLNGFPINMGVWVEDQFAWCNGDGWKRTLAYVEGTLVGKVTLEHDAFQLRLEILDAVAPQEPIFVRRLRVHNLKNERREVRLFFTQDLRINESDIGDTAFFDPFLDSMVHYKGHAYFLFSGATSDGGIYEYAAGIKDFGGMEGTWRDAEDGNLSGNPIAQGSVDSTFSIQAHIGPKKVADARYWFICGHGLDEVSNHYHNLIKAGFNEEIDEATRYWRAWSNRPAEGLDSLPEGIRRLFRQSLLIIRTQIDNGGAVIAANDTDIMKTNRATYSYMWPRDGAFVSYVLDRMGYQQLSRRFFRFCKTVLPKDRPILLHKYGPDGSVGASWHPWIVDGKPEVPFQEDESALTIHSLWEHYAKHQDLEFLGELYDSFVVPVTDFMMRYRDPGTGLPLPSYDLWEERRGVHAFTVGAVAAALRSAAKIADALGDERSAAYKTCSDEVVHAIEKYLFDDQRGVFYRRVEPSSAHQLVPDKTIDASLLGLINLKIFEADNPRVASTIEAVENALTVHSSVGGLARYEGDYYFRESDRYPGNPWIICTLWLAQAKLFTAKKKADLKQPLQTLNWVVSHAASTGVLPEQLNPDTGEPLSVSPLTWSHAEFVNTVLDVLAKKRELG